MSATTLVVPHHNDAGPLRRLLQQAADLGCFDRAIIVDDGSERILRLPRRIKTLPVQLLRHDHCQGAGAARNTGLAQVQTPWVLFFDADDRLGRDLPDLMQDLQGQRFDFCLFRHADSRMAPLGLGPQTPRDDSLWAQAGADHAVLQTCDRAGQMLLSQTTNYPWNKIYCTRFLRRESLRFSAIPVHNDVLVHWQSFARARHVLTSARIGAAHGVHPQGRRLSNQSGAARLRVFDPLMQIATELPARAPWLRLGFARFSCDLIDWIATMLPEDLSDALAAQSAAFWGQAWRDAEWPPALAARIAAQAQIC